MNVVWIVNTPIGPLAEKMETISSSGSWLYAAMQEVDTEKTELYLLTTCSIPERIDLCDNGVTYIALPTGDPANYKCNAHNIAVWRAEFNRIKPDIIQIWGTEYTHALAAAKAKPQGAKVLVYIQGVMKAVVDSYMGCISAGTLCRFTSLIEVFTRKTVFAARNALRRTIATEDAIIKLSDGIICETEWSKSYYTFLNDSKSFFYHRLPINPTFYQNHWTLDGMQRHKIFTPASDYPLKGLHKLLEAIYYVKKIVPDVKLYVPGYQIKRKRSFSEKMKTKAYRRYLISQINQYELWNNIVFTGTLTVAGMAEQMVSANVFVCTSAIENHSSTLREAMTVGIPCISTCVGGIPEVVKNGVNGLLYDFRDSIALGADILRIFNDDVFAEKIANMGHKTITGLYADNASDLQSLYNFCENE